MKTKPPSNKTRKRRTNLELAGFTRAHLATVRRISDESKVPINQVFADVIEIGLVAVLPMYASTIEFRKNLNQKLKTLFEPQDEHSPSEEVGSGSAEEQDGLAPILKEPPAESEGLAGGDAPPMDAGNGERPLDAPFGPGFRTATEEDFGGVVTSDGEILE